MHILSCILPFPLNLSGLSEEFQYNYIKPDYIRGIYYLTIIEEILKFFKETQR